MARVPPVVDPFPGISIYIQPFSHSNRAPSALQLLIVTAARAEMVANAYLILILTHVCVMLGTQEGTAKMVILTKHLIYSRMVNKFVGILRVLKKILW